MKGASSPQDLVQGLFTVDVGNTHGSLAHQGAESDDPRVHGLGRWVRGEGLDRGALSDLLGAAHRGGYRSKRAAVSSVGEPELDAEIRAALVAAGCEVLYQPDPGLTLAIESKETCGMDRQYAMAAALAQAGDEGLRALVIDAGTALTVDAGHVGIAASGGAVHGAPTFLGGAIALGPGSLARAIAAAGARLPEFTADPGAHALGRSTLEALRSGAVVGFRGAVRELCDAIAGEAFGSRDNVRAFVTGGAREHVFSAVESLFPGRMTVDPLLIHRGLGLAAGSHR